MRLKYKEVAFILIASFFAACADGGNLEVFAVFKSKLGNTTLIPRSVVKLRLTVSGPGMSDVSHEEEVQETGTIRVGGVPAGSNRTVLLEGLEHDYFVAYYGQTTANVSSDKDTKVTIEMVQVPAPPEGMSAIEINGGSEMTNNHIVSLTLNADRATEYSLSVGKEVVDSEWHPIPSGDVEFSLVNGEDLILPGPDPGVEDGRRFVTVVFRDENVRISKQYSAQIHLDTVAPQVVDAYVAYTPGSDNPLAVVTKATVGTMVTVTVVSDELLSIDSEEDASLSACSVSTGLDFVLDSWTGITATFVAVVPEGAQDETCTPTVTWSDVAGNEAKEVSLPIDIEVKTSEPSLLIAQDQVTFLRSPWGNAEPESLGTFTIPAGPYYALAPADPLDDEATLLANTFTLELDSAPTMIRVWADDQQSSLMGSVYPNPNGTWPRKKLASLGTPSIYITGLDEAGNEAPPVIIRNTEWVATSNLAGFGRSQNELTSSRRADEYPLSQVTDGAERLNENGMEARGADADAILRAAENSWRKRTISSGSKPSPRLYHSMAYDSSRGRVVLFGGDDGLYKQDTWEWDGINWVDVTPGGSKPSPRYGHSLAYDSARGRVVLFGGWDGSNRQDTWEWGGADGTWVDVTPAGGKPSPRSYHAMAYDSARGRVVLFGGWDGSNRQDTWEWDGADGTWVDVTPAGGKPSPRSYHAMAYDSARGRVVMFGGNDGSYRQDTWEWDGSDWVDKTPVGDKPSPRDRHAMAYDSARGRTVLFGGYNGSSYFQDTWEWNGTEGTWVDVTPVGVKPSNLWYHVMAYDSARSRIVMFGGKDSRGVRRQETWEWNGTAGSWLDVTPVGSKPSPRLDHSMAYDSARRKVVLFGGRLDGFLFLQDTWEWDGSKWIDVIPVGSKPSPRYGHSLAYDSARGRVVMFGGYDGSYRQDTWEWDGNTWVDVTPAGTKPSPRAGHAMAYDSARDRIILFGGYDGSCRQDTWEWDGSAGTWVDVTPVGTMPSPCFGHTIAYDSVRGRIVLFGGQRSVSLYNETWEWDGATGTWVDVTPAGSKPSHRYFHLIVYDSARGRTVLFGGYDGSSYFQDTWEWDGSEWVDVTLVGRKPSPRKCHAMAYDSARGRVVLFGGNDGANNYQDTWEWDASLQRQPSFQFHVDLDAAGVEQNSCYQVRVRSHAGGVFYSTGSEDYGATLYGWRTVGPGVSPGEWYPLASNIVGINASQPYLPPTNAALIEWTSSSPEEALQFILERDRKMFFQVRPSGSSGNDPQNREATVALDYIEVRVRYQAP